MALSRFGAGAVCTALATTWLAACVHFQPRPVSAAQTLAAFEIRTLDDPGLKTFLQANHAAPGPASGPWTLESLILVAFYYHPDLDLARAAAAVAGAAIVTAGERPNPSAIIAPGYDSTTPASLITPWILTFDLDIPFETAGKRGYRVAQARQLSQAARLNIATVAWRVRSQVRARLLDLYAATQMEGLLASQQDVQATTVGLVERQLSAGEISAFEVTQARIALDSIRLARHDAARQRAEARVQLADAMGLTVKALEGVQVTFDDFTRPPSELPAPDGRRQALLNRADILGALAEYEATQAALQLEVARQYPDIHLGPGYQLDQTDSKWTLALGLTLPLFNRNKGAIGEAEARRSEAGARVLAVQARVIGDLERAVTGYQAALQKTATAEAMLAELKRQEQSAQERFKAGEISRLDLSTTQLELYTGALARLAALVKTEEALGSLEDAMQSSVDVPGALSRVPRRFEVIKQRHRGHP
jgi:outer membrane protein TolC